MEKENSKNTQEETLLCTKGAEIRGVGPPGAPSNHDTMY